MMPRTRRIPTREAGQLRISRGRGWMRFNPETDAIEWQNKATAEPVDITDAVLALAAAWLVHDSPEGSSVDLDWPKGTPFASLTAIPALRLPSAATQRQD